MKKPKFVKRYIMFKENEMSQGGYSPHIVLQIVIIIKFLKYCLSVYI